MGRVDVNAPNNLIVPDWGPDTNSRRMAALNLLNANPFAPPNIGIGVRAAPQGSSFTEGTKSDTWLAPQQNFRGMVSTVSDPTIKNTAASAMLPSANTQINPWLHTLGQTQRNPWGLD